jgi:hypothetical protein
MKTLLNQLDFIRRIQFVMFDNTDASFDGHAT